MVIYGLVFVVAVPTIAATWLRQLQWHQFQVNRQLERERQVIKAMQTTLHCMFSSVWDASCTCHPDGTIASSTPHLDQLLGGGQNLVGRSVCSLAANDFDAGRLHTFVRNTVASGTHQALHFQCDMRPWGHHPGEHNAISNAGEGVDSGEPNATTHAGEGLDSGEPNTVTYEVALCGIMLPPGVTIFKSGCLELDSEVMFIGIKATPKDEIITAVDHVLPHGMPNAAPIDDDEATSSGKSVEAGPSELEHDGHAALSHTSEPPPTVTSVPPSTVTGRIFKDIEHHIKKGKGSVEMELRRQLECMIDLGEQEHWLIDMADIEVSQEQVSVLGFGAHGVVIAATFHGTAAAVKTTKVAKHNAPFYKQLPKISNELRILRRVRHPNIVLFFGACIDQSSAEIALVFEQIQGRSLHDFICEPEPLGGPDPRSRHRIVSDMSSALCYLHHGSMPCIIHGDLNASNVFVECTPSPTPRAKLLDFGLSRLLTKHAAQLGGTHDWMAPEIGKDRTIKPRPSADVFSFGLLARFVVTGLQPQAGHPNLVTPSSEVDLSMECAALCLECLRQDPICRPDMGIVHGIVLKWRALDNALYSALAVPVRTSPSATSTEAVTWSDALGQVRKSVALREALLKDIAAVHPDEVVLWLDGGCSGFPILSRSKGLVAFSGSFNLGTPFLDWICDADFFTTWLQHSFSSTVSTDGAASEPINIRLKTPAAVRKGVVASATCNIRFLTSPVLEPQMKAKLARVTLSNLKRAVGQGCD